MKRLAGKYFYLILLLLIWIGITVAVNPRGDFPINDDWSYSKPVYHLTHEGKFIMGDWPGMTLFSQVLWGTFFCKIFGFSFNILRLSTMLSSFMSTFLVFFLIKGITLDKNLSFFMALVWVFNPIFFLLSFTFMTEVHFLFFSLLTLFFYFKYFGTKNTSYLVIGAFFALIATLTRQLGIILPFAFGIAQFVISKKNIKNFVFSFVPFIVNLLVLYLYLFWLHVTHNLPNSFDKGGHLMEFFQKNDFSFFYSRLGLVLFFLSFLFTPAIFFFIPYIKKDGFKRRIIFVIAAVVILIPAMYSAWDLFPCGNTFHIGGLGPRLLKDTCHGENLFPVFSESILNGIRITCMISLIILMTFLISRISGIKNYFKDISSSPVRLIKLCSLFAFICYLGFTIFSPNYFDRYCLPLILFLLIVIVPVNGKILFKKSLPGMIALIIFGFFNILLTHDYFSWNRTRWEALNYLMKEKNIKPDQIDGGFEFNAWFLSETGIFPDPSTGKSWWFVIKDDYVISSGDISGFKKIKEFSYHRYVPAGKDFIYILVHKTK
ncbi:MAG: glycosyltransferase family 39 protein [Bacteroidota bacterium]